VAPDPVAPDLVTTACLVDVYDTIVNSDFEPRARAVSALAGVDTAVWLREWGKTGDERGRGKLSMADSFALTLRACGVDPTPELVSDLVATDARMLQQDSRLYDDAIPFFGQLRSRAIGIALVSNCSDNTRPLLEKLGVLALVDTAVLSCEVGSLKPSREIYLSALDDLGVAAADAVMIDDQVKFCVGAEAVGIRAIQIVRANHHGEIAESGFPVVRSLLDTLPLP
jgi:putative hydrolase of the HAD superfamily